MKIWIDCEWNSYGGELISMALLDKDGRYFYERMILDESVHPWVKINVMPHVDCMLPLTLYDFQMKLQKFLLRYKTIHLISDWPEDIQHFCETLIISPGERINTPPLMIEIRRDLDSVESKVPHHALHDAYGLRDSYYFNIDQEV
jgi:hypothetical protein